MESELIRKTQAFAEKVFKDRSFEKRPFHNIEHTRDVVAAAEEIGIHIDLTEDEMESALLAAWLHDVRYIEGASDHEQKAADKTKNLLLSWGTSHRKVIEVTEAILATKVPQQPNSIISKVICDADLYHLSTEKCTSQSDKLREEWETLGRKSMTDEEWLKSNLDFLENHRYHTPYGQTILQEGKKRNIKKLRKLIRPYGFVLSLLSSLSYWFL